MPRRETRVFLGNLPPGVRIRDVEEFFKKIGRVKNVLIKQSKYGFAEFENSREAEDAVYDMHGRRLLGSKITVEFAKGTQHVKEPRRAPWVAKYGAPQRTKFRLKVLNLSSRISWQDLKDTLRKAGEVTFAEAHVDKRNEGRVELATMEDLERVLRRYQGYDMNGRRIELVKDCEEEKSKSKSKEGELSESRIKSKSRSRSELKRSRSVSKESFSRGKRPRSKSDESCSSGKSESISPSKKVDLDDKDVKRLRKRSHSQSTESKRSIVSRSSKVSKNSERSLSNSEEKEMRTSRTEYERSTSAASDDKILENGKEDTFEREGSNGLNSNKINSDGNRSE